MTGPIRSILAVLLLAAAGTGCAELFGPNHPGERLLLLYRDQINEFYTGSGVVRERLSFEPGWVDMYSIARSGKTLFLRIGTGDGNEEAARLDLCTLTIDWRMGLGSRDDPMRMDSTVFEGAHIRNVSRDGTILYVAAEDTNGTRGLAAIDVPGSRPLAFTAPLISSSVLLGPPATTGDSLLFVTARRTDDTWFPTGVYALQPRTLTMIDSVPAEALGLTWAHGWGAAPDGSRLYVGTWEELVQYELDRPGFTTYTTRYPLGEDRVRDVVVSPDGGTVMVLDESSGVVRLLDERLELIGAVDVSSPLGRVPQDGSASRFRNGTFSADGRTAYILSGHNGFYEGPFQAPKVIVVDVEAQQFVAGVDIPGNPDPGYDFPTIIAPPDC